MRPSIYPTSPSLSLHFHVSKFKSSDLIYAAHARSPASILPDMCLHMSLQLVISRKRLEANLAYALRFWQVDLLVLRQVRGLGEAGVAAREVAFERLLFGVFGAVVHCCDRISLWDGI